MSINLTFPDGNVKSFDEGTTVLEVAKSISSSLAKVSLGATLNEELLPLDAKLVQDGKLAIITNKDELGLRILRDTVAFVLASVVSNKYPKINLGEAQSDGEGFFVDTDKENQIAIGELPELELEIKKLIKNGVAIEYTMMDKADLEKIFADDPRLFRDCR